MSMINNIKAIAIKERVDLFKNKRMLLIMFIFPILYIIMSKIGDSDFGNDGAAFILMHSIMVPILTIASIVAEEKEKNTLKILIMSGVRSEEYFLGISSIVMMYIILGMIIFDISGATVNCDSFAVVIFNIIAIVCSMFIGSLVGCISNNQMNVGPIAVPITLVLFLLPVIKVFKPEWEFLGKYIYSGVLFSALQDGSISFSDIVILVVNFLILAVLFIFFFNTKRIIQSINV